MTVWLSISYLWIISCALKRTREMLWEDALSPLTLFRHHLPVAAYLVGRVVDGGISQPPTESHWFLPGRPFCMCVKGVGLSSGALSTIMVEGGSPNNYFEWVFYMTITTMHVVIHRMWLWCFLLWGYMTFKGCSLKPYMAVLKETSFGPCGIMLLSHMCFF